MGHSKESENGLGENTEWEKLSEDIRDGKLLSTEMQSILQGRLGLQEEEPPTQISRAKFIMRLEKTEDVWVDRLMRAQNELAEAEDGLNRMRLLRYRLNRADENDCLVRFYEEGGRIYFTTQEKGQMGFIKEEEKG